MKKKALIVLSGGQDSTTCLYLYKSMGYELHALTFDYEQRHGREIDAAEIVAELAEVTTHEIVTLGPVLRGTSPLVNRDALLEQYADPASLPGGVEKTFVPMRNQLFLTIAANRAALLGCEVVVTGVCEEDYGGYPDCRRVFIDALEHATRLAAFTGEDGLPSRFRIATPLMHLTKAQTCVLGYMLNGCARALAYTHTSYDGQYPPTGKDHATLLRARGFEDAGLPDPLVLRAVDQGAMDLPTSDNYINIPEWVHECLA